MNRYRGLQTLDARRPLHQAMVLASVRLHAPTEEART